MTEVKNGPYKVVTRSREFHHDGFRSWDICVADTVSSQFPKDKAQCFLHGFDFSGLAAIWVDERNVEISFPCGRVTHFANFALISDGHGVPVEFHATMKDGCNGTDAAKPM